MMRGRSFGSGSRAALASGKRLREKNLSFAQTSSRKSWRVPHPQRRSGFGAVLSALGCPVCPWVTTGIARWVLGFTPLVEPTRTCRTDRAGSLHDVLASEGEERGGLVPSPDLWAGCITYMVRFVKCSPSHPSVVPGLTRDPASLLRGRAGRRAGRRVKPGATGVFGLMVSGWWADGVPVCAVLPIVLRVEVKVLETAWDL